MLLKYFKIGHAARFSLLLASLTTMCPAQSVPEKPAPITRGGPVSAAAPPQTTPAGPKAASTAGSNPAPASAPTTNSAPPKLATDDSDMRGGYLNVSFERLASYEFEVSDRPVTNQTAAVDESEKQIPAAIKGLNGKKVSLTGFMLPLRVEAGKVTEYLIMRNQATCCFGATPKITEWVTVKSAKGVEPLMDQPVSVKGMLRVGVTRENGYVAGIYEMDGEKLVVGSGN
jgi:hypothetical protein